MDFIFHAVGGHGHHLVPDLKYPPCCPYCSKVTHLDFVDGYHSMPVDDMHSLLVALFSCADCRRIFPAYYSAADDSFVCTLPDCIFPMQLPDSVVSDYPAFADIVRQAGIAEARGLDSVAGIAYRKALEFLIKDYLLQSSVGNSSAVPDMSVSQCISLLPDGPLKSLCKRAVWLGNDYAHYKKLFPEYNLADLKTLIQAVAGIIATESVLAAYDSVAPRK